MKFLRNIDVVGYDKVTVDCGRFIVSVRFDNPDGSLSELQLFARESRALRKALKAAETLLQPPINRRDSSV